MEERFKKTLENIITVCKKRAEEEQAEWDALPEEEKQRILEEERYMKEKEQRKEIINLCRNRGIPPRFYDVAWDNWVSGTDDQLKAFQTVKTEAWKTNLFLCGKSGTGKTHLAMCLTKDGATYRRLPDIFREVRHDFDSEQDIINRYGSLKLLIIDEVGRQKFSSFENNLFFEIIDKRWNNMVPTTLITNLNEKEFLTEYGTAIIDRLRPKTVKFNWESRRESLDIPTNPQESKRNKPDQMPPQEEEIDF